MEEIFFYFEKVRVLLSLIPNEIKKNRGELKEFLDKYY
jgi:hypothetical protein